MYKSVKYPQSQLNLALAHVCVSVTFRNSGSALYYRPYIILRFLWRFDNIYWDMELQQVFIFLYSYINGQGNK